MRKPSKKISTFIAVSSGLAALPAAALELGDVSVNSSLGQPLRASIAYALAPNEEIAGNCISLQGGLPHAAVPTVNRAKISASNGVISIVGNAPMRDPLVSMRVNIRCPYAANLSREYTLFIDPAGMITQTASSATIAAPQQATHTTTVVTQPVRARSASASNIVAIAAGARYYVQPGDSLSAIAQAIADRPVGLWQAVDAIFAANPDAFLDNNPNKIRAGSWLTIPAFDKATVAEHTEVAEILEIPAPVATTTGTVDNDLSAYPDLELAEPAAIVEPVPPVEIAAIEQVPEPAPVAASIRPVPVQESSTNWLLWLAGAGIGLIGLLLLFGRLLRKRFGSSPISSMEAPERRRTDSATRHIEPASEIEVEFQEISAASQDVALDADLIIGTGLQESGEMDVAQDFGFAASNFLDLDLPEEAPAAAEQSSATDIIPPVHIDVQSILDSEVLADEDETADDYDMSVIVDATKMPLPEDATRADLAAMPVTVDDETLITGDYTVNGELDYTVLEQDYEDEFSATQALNEEVSRAAMELADQLDANFDDLENTSDMSMAAMSSLDITAQLPAGNDDNISDLDDTGINEALTVDMELDENTAKLPVKKGKSA